MNSNDKPASIDTPGLHQRLNRLYKSVRTLNAPRALSNFNSLWDLKELALMEGRKSVEIPAAWLEELEQMERNEGQAHA